MSCISGKLNACNNRIYKAEIFRPQLNPLRCLSNLAGQAGLTPVPSAGATPVRSAGPTGQAGRAGSAWFFLLFLIFRKKIKKDNLHSGWNFTYNNRHKAGLPINRRSGFLVYCRQDLAYLAPMKWPVPQMNKFHIQRDKDFIGQAG